MSSLTCQDGFLQVSHPVSSFGVRLGGFVKSVSFVWQELDSGRDGEYFNDSNASQYNGFVPARGKIINAKYFPTYFERLPENRTAAVLWEGLQGL